MTRARIFTSNRSQAVRLPKAVAFPAEVDEVDVTVVGDARLLAPVRRDIVDWWEQGTRPTDDFMTDREQPPAQKRDW